MSERFQSRSSELEKLLQEIRSGGNAPQNDKSKPELSETASAEPVKPRTELPAQNDKTAQKVAGPAGQKAETQEPAGEPKATKPEVQKTTAHTQEPAPAFKEEEPVPPSQADQKSETVQPHHAADTTPPVAARQSNSDILSTEELLRSVRESASSTAFFEIGDDEPAPRHERPRTVPQSDRSLRTALGALITENDELPVDTVNKSMLSEAIQQTARSAVSAPVAQPTQRSVGDAEQTMNRQDTRIAVEAHELFSKSATKEVVIEKEKEKTVEITATLEIDPDAVREHYARRTERKSLLNVQDNINDNFREFFGNTVIIDKQSLDEKLKKQRAVKDFVIPSEDDGVGGPVFEDDEPDDPGFEEYTSEEDNEPLLAELLRYRAGYLLRTAVTAVLTAVALVLNLSVLFGSVLISSPTVFFAVNAGLAAALVAVNAADVFPGLAKLVTFRSDRFSLVAFVGIAAFLEAGLTPILVPAIESNPERRPLFVCVAGLALLMADIGELLNASRVLSNFRIISGGYDKYASAILEDESLSARLTRGLDVSTPRVLFKRKTGFTDGFLAHSFSEPEEKNKAYPWASVAFIVSLACGVLGYLRAGGWTEALQYLAAAAALTAPFTATLSSLLPICRMQTLLSKTGTVVPGYSAADEVTTANSIVLAGNEVFPKGNVKLHGIKTFDREPIDKAILYAASVLIQSCETMSHVFMNVIQNKTEMLFPVDSVEFENGLGYSFWVEKNRILLGTRAMMLEHEIEVPSPEYEKKYTKSSNRDAVYLAVSGKLYAMFVMSYSPNMEVRRAISDFVRDGVGIIIHTHDFNLSAERVAMVYRIPVESVTVVREGEMQELSEQMEYVSHAPSAITHIGSLTSFVSGIFSCYRLRSALRFSRILEFVCLILGGVVALVLAVMGSLYSVGVETVLLFQLVWAALLTIVVMTYRYYR